jgi:hypothetical protein
LDLAIHCIPADYFRLTAGMQLEIIFPTQGSKYASPKILNEEKTMKLNLYFTLIDLLIILAYPFVFVWSKLSRTPNKEHLHGG